MTITNTLGERAPQFRIKNGWHGCRYYSVVRGRDDWVRVGILRLRQFSASRRTDFAQDDKSGLYWRFTVLAEMDDLVQDALGHFPFRGFGNLDNFVAADNCDRVTVGIEAHTFS